MPSSRLPAAGHGRGVFPPAVGYLGNGRSSALPRSGSSSVVSFLENQRASSQERPPDCRPYRPGSSKLPSSSSIMLPAPPGFGLPRANERRIQNDSHFGPEKSNTSLRSSDDDFEDAEGEDGGRRADGNPPGEGKKRDMKPMQPIASMAKVSKLGKADSNTNGSDPRGSSSEQLFAKPAVAVLPSGQPPLLSAILRALFPNWVY